MTNPLLELKALGQSVWLDDIDRGQMSPSPQPFLERLSDGLQQLIQVVIGSHRKPPRRLKSLLNGMHVSLTLASNPRSDPLYLRYRLRDAARYR